MASRARSIVINGLFFIFKSDGKFTDSDVALSNSFFRLEPSKIAFFASSRQASRIPIENLLWNTMISEML